MFSGVYVYDINEITPSGVYYYYFSVFLLFLKLII